MDLLQRLIEGNERFVSGDLQHSPQTPDRRDEVSGTQSPFAAIVACADSRVASEIIFDQA